MDFNEKEHSTALFFEESKGRQDEEKQHNSDIEKKDVKNEIKEELEAQTTSKNSLDDKLEESFGSGENKPLSTKNNQKLIGEDLPEEDEENEDEPLMEYLDTMPLYRDPTFAEIISFFNTFAHLLGLQPFSIAKLTKLFTTLIDGQVCKSLIDLHITLLRKIYLKSARADKWENALQKFCTLAPGIETESRQLQRLAYVKIPLASKLNIMKALCDSQFDWNLKFKENIANTFRYNEIRLSTIGSDKTGQLYYFQLDCDLAYCVYTEEPDDMAGASWTLKASNDMELAKLLEALKNPEFGQKTREEEEEDAEMDEEQILDQPKNEEKQKQIRPYSTESSAFNTEIAKKIYMSEEEKAKVQMEDKNAVYWDRYKGQEILNKRKLEREKRKKERLNGEGSTPAKNATIENVQNEQPDKNEKEIEAKNDGNEEVENEKFPEKEFGTDKSLEDKLVSSPELDEALLAELEAEDRRRVLPRRSARSTAMQNIKVFTTTSRKRNESEACSTPPVQKLAFVATAGSGTDEDSEEEESDEEEDEGRTSDDEFYLDDEDRPKVRKMGRPPTKRAKLKAGKTKKGGKAKGKGKKKNLCGRQIARHSAIKMAPSHKQQTVSFIEEESSGDEEETEDEAKREEKERRRATALSLCQRCRKGDQPDLLLLCDSCDDAWHTHCLRPQLWFVPDGDWFCPLCKHASLIRHLTFMLVTVQEERKIKEQSDRKKAAEDRLKREMDFIGSQLNDIMARKNEETGIGENSSEEDEEEDSSEEQQRKSKKRAMKIVMSRTRQQRKMEKKFLAVPVMTVAEGRSRRALNKVDYNFRTYDEQLQEAMGIDSDVKGDEDEVEERCGAGRGKDMQNIIEYERKRDEDNDGHEEREEYDGRGRRATERNENAPARPPKGHGVKKAGRKQHKRLTDLDIDNATESDTDEWKQGSEDEGEEDPEPSEDEYLPSERRTRGIRGQWARHQSDDEFINDDSDPDYIEELRKKKKKGNGRKGLGGWFTGRKNKGGRGKQRGGKRRASTSEEEGEEMLISGSDSDRAGPSKIRNGQTKKWAPRANSSEGEEEEEEESAEEMTETGRPLRRAALNMKKKLKEIEKAEEEEDKDEEEEEENFEEEKEQNDEKLKPKPGENIERLADRAASALAKSTMKKGMALADADEFEPDEDEEAAVDEEEDELEEELAEQPMEDEEEDEEQEESSSSSESGADSRKEESKQLPEIGKRKASSSNLKSIAPQTKKKKAPSARGKKGQVGRKPTTSRIRQGGQKAKKSLTESDEEKEEIKGNKPQSQQLKRKSVPKQSIKNESMASTSIPTDIIDQQSTQRQTRQQLRRQQSSTNTPLAAQTIEDKHSAPALMISTSMGMAANQPLSTILLTSTLPLKTEQLSTCIVEASPTSKKIIAKASVQSRNFESNKLPSVAKISTAIQENETKKTIEIPTTQFSEQTSMVITKNASSSNQQQMLKEIPEMRTTISTKLSNVAVVSTANLHSGQNSANSSPIMKTIFHPVQPQQLSQYFIRPSINTPTLSSSTTQHQPATRHQMPTTTGGTNGPPHQISTTVAHHGPPRFTIQPTTSFAYSIPPTTATVANGNPTFVTVTPQHLSNAGTDSTELIHTQPHLPAGPITHHFSPHSQPTAYFVQSGHVGAPPQIIYQTLQPYTTIMHHPPPSQGQIQQGMTDPESLSHALAGAMNPEDL